MRSARRIDPLRLAIAAAATLAIGCSDAPAPPAAVTAADLNLLHGAFCPPETDRCRLPDRVDLLFRFIALGGCPDVVTLQEVWNPSVELMRPRLATSPARSPTSWCRASAS